MTYGDNRQISEKLLVRLKTNKVISSKQWGMSQYQCELHKITQSNCTLQMGLNFYAWLIDFMSLKNISLTITGIVASHAYCLRLLPDSVTVASDDALPDAKFRPTLGTQGLWAGRDLYRATLAVTRRLRFGCKLTNAMTRDLCTSGDKADFTVCTKVYKWESACDFYRFPDDSMKWTLWGSRFSTCIDNKLGFSLDSFDFIVCQEADDRCM
jgi:hypothetical protein